MGFREPSYLNSINNLLEQHRKMLGGFGSIDQMVREISGVDRVLRSFGGMDQVARIANSRSSLALNAARLAGTVNPVGVNTASLYADLAKRIVPESMRPGFRLARLSRNLASVGHYPRLPSDALRYGKMFGNLGLSSSIAQALKLQGIASSYNADWSLRIVRAFHTPALQSILKSSPTYGPIVISPDDAATPSNYHPDLQEWLIPETAKDSGSAINVEELVDVVFAYALGIAHHHRTRVLITVVGKHGGTFLIRVTENTVAGLLVYWLLSR